MLQRLVAAYLVGNTVEEVELPIPVCASAKATACFVSWNSVIEGGDAGAHWTAKVVGGASSKPVCVNPLTWTHDDNATAPKVLASGALPVAAHLFLPGLYDGGHPALGAEAHTDAECTRAVTGTVRLSRPGAVPTASSTPLPSRRPPAGRTSPSAAVADSTRSTTRSSGAMVRPAAASSPRHPAPRRRASRLMDGGNFLGTVRSNARLRVETYLNSSLPPEECAPCAQNGACIGALLWHGFVALPAAYALLVLLSFGVAAPLFCACCRARRGAWPPLWEAIACACCCPCYACHARRRSKAARGAKAAAGV